MPHLKPEIPTDQEGVKHFLTVKGRLPPAFFDFSDPAYQETCLHATLNWCRPENFKHPLSDTLMGGPFSLKWAVLILGHLELNVQSACMDISGARAHYAAISERVDVQFSETDKSRIRHAINSLAHAVRTSTVRLDETLAEREILDPHALAIRKSAEAHAHLSTDLSGFNWYRAVSSQCFITRYARSKLDSYCL